MQAWGNLSKYAGSVLDAIDAGYDYLEFHPLVLFGDGEDFGHGAEKKTVLFLLD